MKLIRTLVLFLMAGLIIVSCQKEYSEENGGGTTSATGTLKASGSGECLPSSVQGIYIAAQPLTAANFINVTVNITAIGAYSIATNVVNGYSFSATGIATATGEQTIKLLATGTPTAQGANTFTVKFGTSQCSLVVDVLPVGTGAAVITGINCSGAVLAGTYQQGTATGSGNTVQIQATVTTAGTYTISTNSVNGVSFSGSGALAAGTQMVTLTANGGTPTNSGTVSYTVTSGTNTCDFDITYQSGTTPPVGTYTWSFKVGTTTYSGTCEEAELQPSPAGGLAINGTTSGGDGFGLGIFNLGAGIGTGTYPGVPGTTPPAGKFTALFFYEGNPTTYDYIATTGGNITTIVTSFNATTHVVQGTFSGTALDENGATVNIQQGTFKVHYP